MPTIRYRAQVRWANYHRTIGTIPTGGEEPEVTIGSVGDIDAGDLTQPSGLERFSASGKAMLSHLGRLEAASPPGSRPIPVGQIGMAWSFSKLIGAPEAMLDCAGLSSVTGIGNDERHVQCPLPADRIALACGGTPLSAIAGWAEKHGCGLITSGTHLKPTIAGGSGTASHGSRLGRGGLQDMVLGLHLIVGSQEHVWIEPASRPVLSDAGVAKLAIDGVAARVVRDDDMFEDALVHLGGMGIVNGVALELAANVRFALMKRLLPLTSDLLDDVGNGRFDAVATRLGCTSSPEFYELTINPHAPFDDPATHMMYFATSKVPLVPAGDAAIRRPADVIAEIGALLLNPGRSSTAVDTAASLENASASLAAGAIPPWVLPLLLNGSDSVFAYYRNLKQFESSTTRFDPDDPALPAYLWSELHPGEITGGIPGALYNASFAIPLDRVGRAIPAICAAVPALAGSFVFTLRFVTKPAGTLAFTRFDENAVIEIDGLSPLICDRAARHVDPADPRSPELLAALAELATTLPAGAAAVRAALDGEQIPYSMHWAKLGGLDRAKVHADFGHPLDPDSLIRQWRETRERLLTPFGRRVFWNEALVEYGLLDAPPTLP